VHLPKEGGGREESRERGGAKALLQGYWGKGGGEKERGPIRLILGKRKKRGGKGRSPDSA